MKIKVLILTAFTVLSLCVDGQSNLQGYILDKETSVPLSYATICALNQKYGAYSDTTGMFILSFSDERDSIRISYLGYKSLITTIECLQRNERVLLEPDSLQLMEVVVRPQKVKLKEMQLGFLKDKPEMLEVPSYSINMYATFIPFPKNGGTIKMKSIRFRYRLSKINSPIRVHVLKVKNNGEPGDDIITENIIFNNFKKGQNEIAEIDISKYNVSMPVNGVFIALEWIDLDRTPVISMNQAGKNGPYIWAVKKTRQSNPNWVSSYYETKWLESSSQTTFLIGLTVAIYKK